MGQIADNPAALAAFVESLGGSPIDADTFQFTLPLSDVKQAIPKIVALGGLGVRKISEHIDDHPTQRAVRTVAALEIYRRESQQPDHIDEFLTR